MQTVESRANELRGGRFAWVIPLLLVVFILALMWAGLFVVVSDLVGVASSATFASDASHE